MVEYIIQTYEARPDPDYPEYEGKILYSLVEARRVSREEWESSPGSIEITSGTAYTKTAYKRIYPEGA